MQLSEESICTRVRRNVSKIAFRKLVNKNHLLKSNNVAVKTALSFFLKTTSHSPL